MSPSFRTMSAIYVHGPLAVKGRMRPDLIVKGDPIAKHFTSLLPVSIYRRDTHSHLTDRQSLSVKLFSIQQPLLSMEMRTAASRAGRESSW